MSRSPAGGGGDARPRAHEVSPPAGVPRVAVIERRGKFLVAEPYFGSGSRTAVSRDSRYEVGDLVVIRAGTPGRRGAGSRARVERRIGKPEIARDVLEALMVDRGLSRRFEPPVAREAQSAAAGSVSGGDGRRDLRALPTFTIDPVSARDFDDAISCEPLGSGDRGGKGRDGGEGWRVWVHIADVSAYVAPRSAIDREAFRRGTSVYVPGAVEPMLPHELSSGACSLVPGEDRHTVTVELAVSASGDVASAAFHRSVIRSDQRLNYDEVDALFAGSANAPSLDGECRAGLEGARAAALALGKRRGAASSLVLESSEPEFSFDRAGNVVGVAAVLQTESHRLIERLMIAANEQVARYLSERKLPTLYRVHEDPEPESVSRMIDQLASLGVPTPPAPGGVMTPQQAGELAGEASRIVSDWVRAHDGRGGRALSRIVLRSLKQAYYDDRNRGHSGLHLHSYCHFTSPIRRYPDLICHRTLVSAVAGGQVAPESSWVAQAGPTTSAAERRAMTIERDADDIARCFLLAWRLAHAPGGLFGSEAVFEGEVVGVIGAGAFVSFGEGGEFEGLLPVRRMRDDWWELNEQGTALIGTRGGGALRLGDLVAVRVDGIDPPRGRVSLVPAAEA